MRGGRQNTLTEDLLDRVEVGTVWREEQEARASGPDGCPDGGLLVAGEIVEDDDVAGRERGAELLFDPLGEAGAIDWLIEHEGRIDPVAAQRGDEGHRLPMAIRHLGMEPLTDRRPTPERCHVGLGPLLSHDPPDHGRAVGSHRRRPGGPGQAVPDTSSTARVAGQPSASVARREERFFLKLSPSA